jgi:hypothetical protein
MTDVKIIFKNVASILLMIVVMTILFVSVASAETDGVIKLSGKGPKATDQFYLPQGLIRFEMSHDGTSNFIIQLLDDQGNTQEYLVNEIGKFQGSTAVGLVIAGNYLLDIDADGKWTVNIITPTSTPKYTLSIIGLPTESQISDSAGATRTFSITANQTVNVTWYINGTAVKSNETGVTSASYTNTSAAQGTWIVNATATNTNDTVSKEWEWIVTSISPRILVKTPNKGENWLRGTTKKIKWSSIGDTGPNVKIELLKGGLVNELIASSTLNDGSFSWNISSTHALGSDYKISIESTTNSTYKDVSNKKFIISTINCG